MTQQICWEPSIYKHGSISCSCQRRITASSTEVAKAGDGQEIKTYHPWFDAHGSEARDKGKNKTNISTDKKEEDLF